MDASTPRPTALPRSIAPLSLIVTLAALYVTGSLQPAYAGLYYSDEGGRNGWTADWNRQPIEAARGFASTAKCVTIPTRLSYCTNIGYTSMAVPNLLQHDSMDEIVKQANSFVPLVNIGCNSFTATFLCSLFAPMCSAEEFPLVPPCRELCSDIRDACLPKMIENGYTWPDMLNCTRFPVYGSERMCIVPTKLQPEKLSPPSLPEGVSSTHATPTEGGKGSKRRKGKGKGRGKGRKGKKMKYCPQCRTLKKEMIKKKFCQSQFVMKVDIRRVEKHKTSLRLRLFGKRHVLRNRNGINKKQLKRKSLMLYRGLKRRAKCLCYGLTANSSLPTKKGKRATYVAFGYKHRKQMRIIALLPASKVNGGQGNMKYIKSLKKNQETECKGIPIKKSPKKRKNKRRRPKKTTAKKPVK